MQRLISLFASLRLFALMPLLVFIAVASGSCTQERSPLDIAFQAAGNNKKELKKVLNHYSKHAADSLKLKAAEFLIHHMAGHKEDAILIRDPHGVSDKLNILDYEDVSLYNRAIDSLEGAGQLSISRTVKKDITTITAGYLIGQIDLAFQAWEKPWSRSIGFDDFCNYILPYRGGTEPLSGIRKTFFDRYIQALDTVQGLNCPVEACKIINKILKDSIRYEFKVTYVNYSRTVDQVYESGYGGCEDMCLVGLYVMRALGIPVASDMTLWGRMNRGHEWCSVLGAGSGWHAFGPGEDQPGELTLKWRRSKNNMLAKVYRRTYAIQENKKLEHLFRANSTHVPVAIYNSFFLKDVTADYLPPVSVSLPMNMKEPEEFSYLCVYNLGQWKPVDFTRTANNLATFHHVGTDFATNTHNIIYAHCVYRNGRLTACNPPFELYADGTRHEFIASTSSFFQAYLPMENPDIAYVYYYWDNELNDWQELTPASVEERRAFYTHILDNALFVRKATIPSGNTYLRLGVIRNKEFVFYT